MNAMDLIKIIWPLVIIQLAFQIYALIDLFKIKKGKTKNLSTAIWAIIIVLGEIIGAALYFIFGRSEE
ncbi:MAG: PLDc N-terminal domain-containing protein [Candidatus Saccharibacteria bacterium]|nr:PLDc N-terminal domain-containing protein [Candidatus Saccharibacteria bacterium]